MNKDQQDFQSQLTGAIPRWALSICAILFCLALTLRIIGIDPSTAINTVMMARAEAIKNESSNDGEIIDRIERLEHNSHSPAK